MLTVAVENYITPRYACHRCPANEALRVSKGCKGEVKQKVGDFSVDRCPGNYLHSIDYLLDLYMRWKRCGDFSEQPAKVVDICYFIDDRIEKHKEFLRKEADRKAKARGVARGHSPKRRR